MRSCDVAVLGLGLMGSAALDALLTAGVNALGFDPLGTGATRGSSHGSCRVFRRFNFENDNYTDLSDAAHAGWKRLEAASGEAILDSVSGSRSRDTRFKTGVRLARGGDREKAP